MDTNGEILLPPRFHGNASWKHFLRNFLPPSRTAICVLGHLAQNVPTPSEQTLVRGRG
jgi:hypothetical protein